MKNKKNENDGNIEIKTINESDEEQGDSFDIIRSKDSFDKDLKLGKLLNSNNNNNKNEPSNNKELLIENYEFDEREHLINVLTDLTDELKNNKNKTKFIDKIYEIYLDNQFITKSHIKDNINSCILKFVFFVIGPLYGIIFLIGIFQMK